MAWCFILQKKKKKTFKSPKEFREESQWMFHNAIIYFGGIHQMELMGSDKFVTSWNFKPLFSSFLQSLKPKPTTDKLIWYCQMLSMKTIWHVWLKFSGKSSHSIADSKTFFITYTFIHQWFPTISKLQLFHLTRP